MRQLEEHNIRYVLGTVHCMTLPKGQDAEFWRIYREFQMATVEVFRAYRSKEGPAFAQQ